MLGFSGLLQPTCELYGHRETGDDHDDKRRNILAFEPIMEKAPNIMKKAPNIMVFEPNITGKAPSIVVFEPNIMEKSTECNGV